MAARSPSSSRRISSRRATRSARRSTSPSAASLELEALDDASLGVASLEEPLAVDPSEEEAVLPLSLLPPLTRTLTLGMAFFVPPK